MKFQDASYTVFDFETTGLFAGSGDAICEIGALKAGFDGNEQRFEELIDPRRPISQGAYNLNRITPEMLEGKPTIDEVLPDFMDFIEGSVLVAYNARFDISFLAAALGKKRTILNEFQVIDVLELARDCFNVNGRYNLGNVAAHFGIKQDVAHRAMPDVISTWKIFKKAVPILEKRGFKNVEDIARIYSQSDVREVEQGGPIVEVLLAAIKSKIPVKIRYRTSWQGKVTERTITPLSIRGEYVHSFCHLRGENRTFLMDCIEIMEQKEEEGSCRRSAC
ncbi:MAG: exonuclease domain-containing protein [Candidatus Omnitrophota bacterium]